MKTKFSGVSELCIPLEKHANIYQRTNLTVRMRYCHQSQENHQSLGRSENQKGKYFSPELPGMGCSGLGVRWAWAQGIYVPSLLSVDGLTTKCFHSSGLNTWCPAGISLWKTQNMGRLSLGPLNILSLAFSCPFLSLLPVGHPGQNLCQYTPISENQAEPLCLLHCVGWCHKPREAVSL